MPYLALYINLYLTILLTFCLKDAIILDGAAGTLKQLAMATFAEDL